jgi:hypothetical protein
MQAVSIVSDIPVVLFDALSDEYVPVTILEIFNCSNK